MPSDNSDDVEEDIDESELEDCKKKRDKSNELVKISNQICVICLERDSDYVFKQCGHPCKCEQCFQNKDNFDILRYVIYRT